MNKQRRKALEAVSKAIGDARAIGESHMENFRQALIQAKEDLDDLHGEEQEYLSNLPDNMANSDAAERAQAAIDAISEAISSVEDAESKFTEITDACEEAVAHIDTAKE